MSAAKAGEAEAVQIALDLGVCVDAANEGGMTALIFAASWGHKEVVKQLLEAQADANKQDKSGTVATPTEHVFVFYCPNTTRSFLLSKLSLLNFYSPIDR